MGKKKPTVRPLPSPAFAIKLLAWYDEATTEMPWRGERDPYRIWLSEVMLQQTRIAAVEGYYRRFLERFPTIQSLAKASLDEVLKLWEGLGYYARARNLHRLAQLVVNEYNGQFPASADALQELPGIGRYTAAAIASIAFGEAVAVLDGNVVRVLTRLIDLAEEISQPKVKEQLWMLANDLLPAKRPGDYNQALMDLGRMICTPRRPDCPHCPVREFCQAAARGTQELRPVKKPKAPLPEVHAAAAVIQDEDGRLLLVRRSEEGLLGGLWMLPGGRCEPGESYADCLQRSLKQTLGVQIRVGQEMAATAQTLTHFRLRLRAFACEVIAGTLPSETHWAWATPPEVSNYSLGKADREIVDRLEQWQPRLFEE
ncbi:MAG: A/G-specific adenine glycosylase [Acidobacteria bacterium]|nr:A/G-specific adenine glycosylase [Acidobacteriota bacterium]